MPVFETLAIGGAALLVVYMLYKAFAHTASPEPEEGASSGAGLGGGHDRKEPDATGDPGAPSAE